MKKLYLIISFILISIVITWCSDAEKQVSQSEIQITKNNINLGEIPMDEWKIEIPFELVNSGQQDIVLWNAETSCMCTEWYIVGDESNIIKMRWHWAGASLNKTLKPGETTKLIAIYDPNAHWPNGTGQISRHVYVQTNSATSPTLDFVFNGNVVKTRSTSENIK